MKAYRFMTAAAFLTAVAASMTACEYDVAEPLCEKDFTAPSSPQITTIEPDEVARAGVNLITIRGANFAPAADANLVYFGATTANVVEATATSITVYRPNLATDSCEVKVVSEGAFLVAKYPKKYRIDPVVEEFGRFRDNLALSVAAVDQAENLYVVETGSRNIYKITPNGERTTLGQSTRAPTDAKFGPDGKLYLPCNNREILVMEVTTEAITRWIQLPAGKVVRYGDFDANGNFFTSGARTDLMIVAPDLTTRAAGVYASMEIVAVRVYNSFVYVAARETATAPAAIWRHALDAAGNLGRQEMVIDMNATAFASRTLSAFMVSANGTVYLATDSMDPFLIVDPATKSVDIFYKRILPPYCKHVSWGAGNYFYMISGDTDLGEVWTVYRVDAGIAGGAP